MTNSNRERGQQKGMVPVVPVLRTTSFGMRRRTGLPSLLDAETCVMTTSGRAAIALALQQLEVEPGDEVLVPAYHCLAMTGPIKALHAKPVFYQLHRDLTIDLDDLTARATPKTRAVLAVHFFGVPTPLSALRAWCDRTGIALIEDCAHTLYGMSSEGPVGRTGDFAVGSIMKFFPVFDGGCLVSFRRPLRPIPMRTRGLLAEVKTAVDILERSAHWSPGIIARLIRASLRTVRLVAKTTTPSLAQELSSSAPSAATGSVHFESQWANVSMSHASRVIMKLADCQRLVERRRAFFQRYSDTLRSVEGGRPLLDELSEGTVPYVFPFVLADPQRSFKALWEAGVPMYRWEDVATDTCATAKAYKDTLVQFPCHQELDEDQFARLLATIVDTLRRSARV